LQAKSFILPSKALTKKPLHPFLPISTPSAAKDPHSIAHHQLENHPIPRE